MGETTLDKIEYIVMFLRLFSRRHRISDIQAYQYLSQYGGIRLIDDNYGVMHTQSFEDMMDSVETFCSRQGGSII